MKTTVKDVMTTQVMTDKVILHDFLAGPVF